ncbi:MAG: hypothetical protein K6G56_00830 [Clostridiales bacterium]|nr:hypothetical protein [Clostridiales bacterium]
MKTLKKLLAIFIAAAMIAGVFPASVFATGKEVPAAPSRAVLDPGVAGLSATTGSIGTWAVPSSGTITGLVKARKQSIGFGSVYYSQSDTLTLTNDSTFNATLSFSWTVTASEGTFKIGSTQQSGSSGNYSGQLNVGSSLTITLTSNKSAAGYNTGIGVTFSNITLTPIATEATVTFIPGEHGSYTVDGTAVTSSLQITRLSTVAYNLSATPDSGYELYGWHDETNDKYLSRNNPASVYIGQSITVKPVFIRAGLATFNVSGNYYFDLNEANAAAIADGSKKITLAVDGSVYDGNYEISSGVTLLIPYDSSEQIVTNSNIANFKYAYGSTIPDAVPYRTLYFRDNANVTVKGKVCVASGVHIMSQGQAGPYGLIVMDPQAKMTFESGSVLYAFGYIKGTGSVEVKSGATVYENLFVADYPGSASNLNTLKSAGVFPFSKFTVKNVWAPMTLYSGASESVYFNLYGTNAGYHDLWLTFMGSSSSALFRTDGSITKSFAGDRQIVRVNGNSSINPMSLSMSVSLISVNINTSDLAGIPIPFNFTLIAESGTITMNENVILSKGTVTKVDEGAKIVIPSGKNLYVLDGSDDLQAVGTQPDAQLDVNGRIEVSGKLWTSTNKARIISSHGTGVIQFKSSAGTAASTVKVKTGSTTAAEVAVAPASLMNGVDDPRYAETSGTGTSTWYYDSDGLRWYRYKVDFVYNGSVVGHGYFCEDGSTVSYDASWLTNVSASVTSGSASASVSGTTVNVTNVTSDCTVTLTGTSGQYIPVFVLNESQYASYVRFTGNTLSETREINGKTHYVVNKAPSAMSVGTAYAAPTDASMGVSAANNNGIVWNLTGVSPRSGMNYNGKVPVGAENGGEVYVYGFYTGMVAYNSRTDSYYPTLAEAMANIPMDGECTVRLVMDCGSFEDESSISVYIIPETANVTVDVNGFRAVGRLVNKGSLTLDLKGGVWEYATGATAAAAAYKGIAAIINSGSLTIVDTVGGGRITSDAISNASGSDGSAVIRNNAGATLAVIGKSGDSLLALSQIQKVNTNNYGIFNLGTITELTNVDISTANGGSCGLNLYNYNTGVVNLISGGHMFCCSDVSIFNYGGTITEINGLTIDGKYGISNRNIRGGAIASGYTVAEADKGVIGTIVNCHIEVGFYAINNHAVINTMSNSTFIAHPDSAQVDTRGNGLATASEGNTNCNTIINNYDWWYNTNVWKQVDSSSNGYTRTIYYKEDANCRPTIDQIINCNIYAENTSNSSSHGYALVNYGIINKIGGTTEIKTYKHPDNTKISTSHYSMHNLSGGIIRSIEGTVNISATGIGTVYNDGAFTEQIDYKYGDKVGGNVTYQYSVYGQPSEITSITCSGTWSCGTYYALYNTGYIQTIDAPGLTLSGNTGSYNVLYNASAGANSTFEYTRSYTDVTASGTEYRRVAVYTKNLEKGSTIGTINGITLIGKYYVLNNQGHIGTLSNVTVSNNAASNEPTVLNGDLRYGVLTEDRQTNRSSQTDPHLTVTAGIVTRYDREYTCSVPPTIDTIDNLTVNSNGQYAFRNAGAIGTLRNSAFTATTNYALHNSAAGPYTERTTLQYYSGTGIFTTSKYTSESNVHYKRNAATINSVENCVFKTNTGTYAVLNSGHIGTIKNSDFRAGATTAAAFALANINNQEREYTRNLEEIMYVTANASSSCTAYWGTGGESEVIVYDYEAPSIDLIGEGNTFTATTTVIANNGIISAIDSQTGALTIVTGSAQKGIAIYNYIACLDSRTSTTPYTAAASQNASGTKGTTVHDDTPLSGAHIGTIKNTVINANGVGIQNGSANASYLPVIDELGAGLEVNANCTTAGYHAVYNTTYAKIAAITGGIYTAKTATTNAYRNNNTNPEHATFISGGDFKGMAATKDNAIFEPDNTNRQTYPEGLSLCGTESVTLHDGTTASGYYFIGEQSAQTYTITWKNWDGTVLGTTTVAEGETPSYSGQTPTRPATAQYTYAFSGWTPSIVPAAADATYTAQFTPTVRTYTITWKMDDGYVIDTTTVAYGATPTHADPAKDATAQYTYAFAGWTPAISEVTADATYTATFTPTVRTYTITWKMDDDSVIDTTTVAYGAIPTHADPAKDATAQYTYTFAGWTPAISEVTGDATYTATFTPTVRTYTITWKDEDGNVLETDENVPYGAMPEYNGATPEKAADADHTYSFFDWDPKVIPVTEDAVYTATYCVKETRLTVRYVYEDGTEAAETYTAFIPVYTTYNAPIPALEGYFAYPGEASGFMREDAVEITVTYYKILRGDVDCDGDVDFEDVALLYGFLLNKAELSVKGIINADFNEDGKVDTADVTCLVNYILNI